MERSGDVLLVLDGRVVVGVRESLESEEVATVRSPIRLAPSPEGSPGVRLVVAARWDDASARSVRARLLWRPCAAMKNASDFWRLLPSEVLTPDENSGPSEFLRARRN